MSLHHLVEALKTLLQRNAKRLQHNVDFQQLPAENDEGWLVPPTQVFALFDPLYVPSGVV